MSHVTYLNHGTVGAVPRAVLAAQQAIRDEVERRPSQFMLRELTGLMGGMSSAFPSDGGSGAGPTRLRDAARRVARFLGARGADLVFVDNATAGISAVLRSIRLEPGDEILVTDHTYGAIANAAEFVARERRAVVRRVAIPYPQFDRDRLMDALRQGVSARTRVAVLDHITSESALIMPLAEMAECCRSRGVAVLVDGAHAPGTLPVDIPSLGVDWYAGNLHKWAHTPRSCGILWADPARQAGLHPPVISWRLDAGFTEEFDWVGTRDASAWLAAPAGIDFLNRIGLDESRRYNHDLAWEAARALSGRWGTSLGVDEASVGSMVTIPVPAAFGSSAQDARRLRDTLLDEDRIEVQVHASHGRVWVRVSAQVYNDWSDIERLGLAIERRLAQAASRAAP
jgi:isopenicillin-N epimerase